MKNDLTEAWLQKLQEGFQGHHLEKMLMLALLFGIRRDELRCLTWQEVDLEKGEMQVLNSKTKSPIRRIHMPENVVHMLKQHALRQEEQHADSARQDLGLVFPDSIGGKLSSQGFLQEWYALRERVGIPFVRFHNLRASVWRGFLEQERIVQDECERTQGGFYLDENADE